MDYLEGSQGGRSFVQTESATGAEAPRSPRRDLLTKNEPRDGILALPAFDDAWGGVRPSLRSIGPDEGSAPRLIRINPRDMDSAGGDGGLERPSLRGWESPSLTAVQQEDQTPSKRYYGVLMLSS